MKVGQAFPGILERRYPIVKPDYTLITVLYVLRMQDVEAVPIFPLSKKNARVVFGYSSLSRMVKMTSDGFDRYVNGPCEKASSRLPVVDPDDDVEDLLKAFEADRLGVAVVYDGESHKGSLITLADFLGLYGNGVMRSDLTAAKVGSKVYSMPGSTTIREAIQAMSRRGHRRVFVSGKGTFVSDKTIMRYLFNPVILEDLDDQKDFLSTPIVRMQQLSPRRVSPLAPVSLAAATLLRYRGGCLSAGEGTLVTQWDVVMKPWLAGALTWGKRRR